MYYGEDRIDSCANSTHTSSTSYCFARREARAREYSLIMVRTDDGIERIGHCYAGHSGGKVVTTAVKELPAPMLIGTDPTSTELH